MKEELKNLENELGIKIPDIYQAKTGRIFSYTDPFDNTRNKISLDRLFSNKENYDSNLDMFLNDFRVYSKPLFEEKMILPFGEDAGGYFFCLDYRYNKNEPHVVVWIRDNPDGYDIAEISSNFDQFTTPKT